MPRCLCGHTFLTPWNKCSGVGLLAPITSHLPKTTSCCIHTSNGWVFGAPGLPQHLVCSAFGHLNTRISFPLLFQSACLWWQMMWNIFSCAYFRLGIFFGKVSVQAFDLFPSFGLFVYLLPSFTRPLCVLKNSLLSDNVFCKYYPAAHALSLYSLDSIVHRAVSFNFNKVYLTIYFYHGWCFGAVSKKASLSAELCRFSLISTA